MTRDLRYVGVKDLPRLPARPLDSHKMSVGSVLAVSGSYGMAGAACLASTAALRAGAGYVRLACPANVYEIAAVLVPSAVFVPLEVDERGIVKGSEAERIVRESARERAAMIGPGLGESEGAANLVYGLVEKLSMPRVFDGSALGALARRPEALGRLSGDDILTPHPGEMAALVGMGAGDVQADRMKAVEGLARRTRAAIVLKGHRTLVFDGQRVYENRTGNAGMAKAGSGDVLTGIVAALRVQGLGVFEAAALGVYLHGKAGDIAAARLGRGLTAEDIADAVPTAFAAYDRGVFEKGGAL
jgi:NAD(P)H-hydrate epimerase